MRTVIVGLCLAISNSLAFAADFEQEKLANWHQFRGPLATGVAPLGNPPTTWDANTNVKWRVPIAGRGISTPIVWGDKIFLTTAIETDQVDPSLPSPADQPKRQFGITFPNTVHQFAVICLDRKTGRQLWQHIANEKVPYKGTHGDNNFASATPTTDGQHLYVSFGSQGFYCLELDDGQLVWRRDLGNVDTRLSFGEATSLTVHQDRLFIVRDSEDQSYIEAVQTSSGKSIWRIQRDEVSAWATPIVVQHKGTTQVITNGKTRVRSYDFDSGKLLWECGGQVSNVIPSPVASGGVVYCMSGYRGAAAKAIRLDARGDVTEGAAVLWSLFDDTPYVPSPLLVDGLLYFTKRNQAILTCVDAKTGRPHYGPQRMNSMNGLYASPVAAAGRVYLVSRGGTTLVLKQGPEYEVLATNTLDEPIDASPVIAGDQLLLRTAEHLYCFAE